MNIRKAEIEDIEQIAKVHIACWKTTYKGIFSDEFLENLTVERSKRNWENTFSNFPESITLVAENEENEIIGFCGGGLNRDKEKCPQFDGELIGIYILKEYQKKGIGTELTKVFIQELIKKNIKNMVVWVLRDNDSKYFYEKLGGKLVAEKMYKIGGRELVGIAYGFEDLKKVF